MSETINFGDIELKCGTEAEYLAVNESLPENSIALKQVGSRKILVIGVGGGINDALVLPDEETTEQLVNDAVAGIVNGPVVDLTGYKLLNSKNGDLIYSSEISNIINPEHFEVFDSNRKSVNGIEVYEEYENIVPPSIRNSYTSQVATTATQFFQATLNDTVPADTIVTVRFKFRFLINATGATFISLKNYGQYGNGITVHAPVDPGLEWQEFEYDVPSVNANNSIVIYLGRDWGTLGNQLEFRDMIILPKGYPVVLDKHEADTVIISTESWDFATGFQIGLKTDVVGFVLDNFGIANERFLLQRNENGSFWLYINGVSLNTDITNKEDLITISFNIGQVRMYANGVELGGIYVIPVFLRNILYVGTGNIGVPTEYGNGQFTELFYSSSTVLIAKPIADSGIEYYPNGSYKDKLGQIRLQGDNRDYELSRDNRFLTSPENGDIVYHVEGAASLGGHTVHENIKRDSVYPRDGSIGVWCGESYKNDNRMEFPISPYSNAVLESIGDKNNLFLNITTIGIDGWMGMALFAAATDSYLSFSVPDGIAIARFRIHTGIMSDPELMPDGRHELFIAGGNHIYFWAGGATSYVLNNIMVTTVSGAPYIKNQNIQPASAVKIDTSKWNKENGSFGFTILLKNFTGPGITLLDTRESNISPFGITMYKNGTGTYFWIDNVNYQLTEDISGLKNIVIVWYNSNTFIYINSVLRLHAPQPMTLPTGFMNFHDTTVGLANMNCYISNIAYSNSTELSVKPLLDPRFKLTENQLIDMHGAVNDTVWYTRILEKATAVEAWVIGEDIPFENGWVTYGTTPYYTPKLILFNGRLKGSGLIRGGNTTNAFSLPQKILDTFPAGYEGEFTIIAGRIDSTKQTMHVTIKETGEVIIEANVSGASSYASLFDIDLIIGGV